MVKEGNEDLRRGWLQEVEDELRLMGIGDWKRRLEDGDACRRLVEEAQDHPGLQCQSVSHSCYVTVIKRKLKMYVTVAFFLSLVKLYMLSSHQKCIDHKISLCQRYVNFCVGDEYTLNLLITSNVEWDTKLLHNKSCVYLSLIHIQMCIRDSSKECHQFFNQSGELNRDLVRQRRLEQRNRRQI